MMMSCDDHLRQMKLSADFVHPLKHPCGLPGSTFRWPENECYMEWDETAEFAEAALTLAFVPRSGWARKSASDPGS